ncbi:MAG: acyl-CoA thioesterase [Phycisphaerales bacterium]
MPATSPHDPSGPSQAASIDIRVRYCECDPMGVAHHASFVPWLEMARTEALRALGRTYAQMEADGVYLVVTNLDIRYRRPARYDDVLRVSCRAEIAGRARLRHHYVVELVETGDQRTSRLDDQPLATGSTELACVDGQGRPVSMPAWLSELIPDRAGARD